MILRLLRFLNHPIARELARLETEKAMLQDRLERGDQERSRLWEQNAQLLQSVETSYQMQVNVEWQERGAPAPFPDSPHLPKTMVREPDNTPQPAHRSQGSQLVNKQYRDFKDETKRRMFPAAESAA